MSTRNSLRRKVVLALHVVRRTNGQKQLAHTLDITRTSARLGGLNMVLEPGEVVEIRRGAIKARFEVMWMGAPASPLDGQSGVRTLEPEKEIWGVNLPEDEQDITVNAGMLRTSAPPVRTPSAAPNGKRSYERYPCSGSASIKTQASSFALHGQVKDISEGGVYVEMTSPIAVDTEVTIGLKIEGTWIEFAGTVRTSYPLVGMGVSFRKLTDINREKLQGLLESLRRKTCAEKSDFIVEVGHSSAEVKGRVHSAAPAKPETYPLRVLALACQTLATNFDASKGHYSPAEIEELRLAISLLQQKLSPPHPMELAELLVSALPGGTA